MKHMLVLAMVLGAIGCNPPTTNTNTVDPIKELPMGVLPGTRLTPKLLLADDGTSFLHPTIWNDAEFGECVFTYAEDGKRRCLPPGPLQTKRLFVNDKCTQEAVLILPAMQCGVGKYAWLQDSPKVCPEQAPTRLVEISEPTAFVAVYAIGPDGSCNVMTTLPSPSVGEIRLVVRGVDAAQFVSAWQ